MTAGKVILAVVAAVAVSFLLTAVMAWRFLSNPDNQDQMRIVNSAIPVGSTTEPDVDSAIQKLMEDIAGGNAPEADAALRKLAQRLRRTMFAWFPVICFISGLTAGIVGTQKRAILGVIGAAPFVLFMRASTEDIVLLLCAAAAGELAVSLVVRLTSSNKAL